MSLRLVREFFNGGWNYRAEEEAAGGGGAALTAIRTVGATLTDAQIKALPTTPVEILAAPPVGTLYVPLFMVLYLDTSEFQYGNIDAESSIHEGAVRLNTIHQQVGDGVELLLANFEPTYIVMAAPQRQFPGDDTHLYATGFESDGGAITLASTNNLDFTGGDPSMEMKVQLAYYAIDLTA